MTIELKIDENDFLTHQLYTASKSARIKRKRQRNKVVMPLIYIALGIVFFFSNRVATGIIFFIIAPLWFFIYPVWERQRYIKHYKDFIKENYKDRHGSTGTLELSNDYILAKDNGGESKVLTKEIEVINEIPSAIYIKLKGGQSFILPKDKISDTGTVTIRLKELAAWLSIPYNIEDTWEWK